MTEVDEDILLRHSSLLDHRNIVFVFLLKNPDILAMNQIHLASLFLPTSSMIPPARSTMYNNIYLESYRGWKNAFPDSFASSKQTNKISSIHELRFPHSARIECLRTVSRTSSQYDVHTEFATCT